MPFGPDLGVDAQGLPIGGGPASDPSLQVQPQPGAKPVLKGQAPPTGEMTTGDYIKDASLGAVGGVGKAINETSNFAYDTVNGAAKMMGSEGLPDENPFRLPEYKPTSMAGEITSGITQFATGFIGAGKFLKAFKLAEGLGAMGKAGEFAHASLQGAIADFVVFDPHEHRFSNLLKDMGVESQFTDYLASDPTDSAAEGRFKNAVEGLALGAATEPFLMLGSAIKKARAALKDGGEGGVKAAAEVVATQGEQLDNLLSGRVPSRSVPIGEGEEAVGQMVNVLSHDTKGTVLGRNADGTLTVQYLDKESGHEVQASFKPDEVQGLADKRPQFQPAEKVEVYSPGEGKRLAQADEQGFVHLKDKERFVIEKDNAKMTDVPVDTEKLTRALEDVKARGLVGPEARTAMEDAAMGAVNVRHIVDEKSAQEVTQTLAEAFRSHWDDGIASNADLLKESQALAETIGLRGDINQLGSSLHSATGDMQETGRLIGAAGILIKKGVADLQEVAARLAINPNKADTVTALQLIATQGNLVSGYKGAKKEAARITQAGNIFWQDAKTMNPKEMQALIDAAGGDKRVLETIEKIGAAGGDPLATLKLLEVSKWGKFMDIHNEYWVNAILSGPKTSVVNMTSNLINALALPTERIVGGILTGDMGSVKEGMRLYAGMAMYAQDAMKMAYRSLKMSEGEIALRGGNSVLDVGKSTLDIATQKITGKAFGLNGADYVDNGMAQATESAMGTAVDYLGQIIRIPSRFLGAQDEFFKQLMYRAKVYSDLVGKGIDVHGITDKKALADFVGENFTKMFDANGAGTYGPAMELARYATFTKDLEYGAGKWMQSGAAQFPAFRVIVPFIRTPVNIFRQAWQMTPVLGRFQKQFAADLASSDKTIVAAARGREALGGLLWTSSILAASTGQMTGGGPKDPALRERWLEAGNQPYSFITTDSVTGQKTFTSFARLDPFSTLLGVAADYAEAGKYMKEDDLGHVAQMMGISLTRNITSKSYLKGLIDTLAAVNDPDRNMGKWVQQRAATYVPFSGAMGQVRQETDDSMREVRSVMDAMINKVPGMSDSLPAKRSWVTGDPVLNGDGDGGSIPDLVNPFASRKASDNKVLQELAHLQHGIKAPAEAIGNVLLNTEQYSRLKELHGTVRLSNRTMSESLDRVMSSDKYDINRERTPDGPDELTDHRMTAVKKVVETYRRAAQLALLKEDTTLHQAYVTDKRNVRMAKRGKYDELQSLF